MVESAHLQPVRDLIASSSGTLSVNAWLSVNETMIVTVQVAGARMHAHQSPARFLVHTHVVRGVFSMRKKVHMYISFS